MVYCDSNLLVRLYAQMPDSDRALEHFERLRKAGDQATPITWLHQVEVANAFEQLVFLSRSGGGVRMTPEQAAVALAEFENDLTAGQRLRRSPVETPDLIAQARQLSHRHSAKHGFRTYDIIHVASALLLKCDAVWSFDTKANKLAALEGLKTL